MLNDDLVREAMRLSGVRSKRAVVEEALRADVEIKAAERRSENYRERLRRIEARVRDLRLREGPADILRADRDNR